MQHPKHIVVLMAGRGSRYALEGYTIPKPYIEFNKIPLFFVAALSWRSFFSSSIFHFVYHKNHEAFLSTYLKLLKGHIKNFQLHSIDEYTNGPLCTALGVSNKIGSQDSIVFQDCDCYFENPTMQTKIQSAGVANFFGCVNIFKSNKQSYSYVFCDEKSQVIQAAEKKVISNLAIGGAYFFSNIENFILEAHKVVKDYDQSEPVISSVINSVVQSDKKFLAIESKRFVSIGTPEEFCAAEVSELFNEVPILLDQKL